MIKANDNSYVIKTVIDNGGAFEVDSIQHIKKLVIHYAVNPRNIFRAHTHKNSGILKIVIPNSYRLYKAFTSAFVWR